MHLAAGDAEGVPLEAPGDTGPTARAPPPRDRTSRGRASAGAAFPSPGGGRVSASETAGPSPAVRSAWRQRRERGVTFSLDDDKKTE